MYKALFYIEHLYHRASLDPVYRALVKNGGFKIDFFIGKDQERKFLFFNRPLKNNIEKELKNEGLNIAEDTKGYDIVITGDIVRNPEIFGDTIICFINHGTGIKTILYRLLEKQKNTRYMIFVEGEYRKNKIIEHDVKGMSDIFVVGYPKLDPYFKGVFNKNNLLKKMKLDPDLPTITYAPTYKPTSITYIKDEIIDQCKDINLIVKLHQYSWRGKYAPHWHHRIYEKNINRHPNTYLSPPDQYNIIPILSVSDTMLTEASSTMFEFLAMGKTGIIFDLPCDKLKHSDGRNILDEDNRNFLEGAFVHIHSPDQIKDAVNRAINPPADYITKADEYRNELFYKLDGSASERITEIISGFIQ